VQPPGVRALSQLAVRSEYRADGDRRRARALVLARAVCTAGQTPPAPASLASSRAASGVALRLLAGYETLGSSRATI
jgi:hypothetical protein